MTEIQKSDDKKPKYDKPLVIDLGESPKGQGLPPPYCSNGSANAYGCNSGGSGTPPGA